MKKILLIIVAVLMITTKANCQWVQRKYGVNDINMLSTEQLNGALRSGKVGAWGGACFSSIGAIFIFSGIQLPSSRNMTRTNAQENRFYKNFSIITGSVLGLIGINKLAHSCQRVKSIKKALKNKEINLGLSSFPTNNIFSNKDISSVPSISLTISF